MAVDNRRVQAVFLFAVEAADSAARAAILDRECVNDAMLRQRVEALLQAHDASVSLLDRPPPQMHSTVDKAPLSEGAGSRIGPYKLLKQIGEGGMGAVFLAEQTKPGATPGRAEDHQAWHGYPPGGSHRFPRRNGRRWR